MKRAIIILAIVLLAAAVYAESLSPMQQAWNFTWKGDYNSAIASYQAFVEKNGDNDLAPVALFNSGSIKADQLSDIEGAQQDFERLTQLYPDTKWAAEAWCRLGEIALQSEDQKKAVNCYKNALQHLSGDDYEMSDYWIGQTMQACQNSLNELDDAAFKLSVYQELAQFTPPGETAINMTMALGEAQLAAGEEEQAANTFADLMLTYSTFPQIAGLIESQKELVSKYRAGFPWEDVGKMSGLMTLIRQEQLQEAMDLVNVIDEKYDESPLEEAAKLGKIIVQVRMDADFETALDDLEFFVSKYPESVWAARAKEQMEFMDQMVELGDRLKFNPDDYGTHMEMGWTLVRQRYNQQAEGHFQVATADSASDLAYLGLGYTYLRMQENEKCVAAFETYLSNHPDEGDIYNRVGYAYIQLGNLEKALAAFERYKELEPDNPNSHDSYAECLMNLERYEEAIASYTHAIEINPDFTNPYFMLGQVYSAMENYEEAVKWYQAYLEKDPAGFQSAMARERIDEINQK